MDPEVDSEMDSHEELSSSPEDELDDSTFKQELLRCLDDVISTGSFSAYEDNKMYPNPGLHVNGLGLVPFPLNQHYAEALSRISSPAPFGKGDETLVDVSVRKTWEINNSDFQFRNPSWEAYVDIMVERARKQLGVEVQVCAERYKLLLYEKGAFFKPHKDTEKVPGMFGTLVICLPSKHEGGEVHLSHAGQKKVLQTAPMSEFSISALAWYSDVTHEIKPITSGYRLVVTYNLVEESHSIVTQSAHSLDERRMRLTHLLLMWQQVFLKDKVKLVYILEHQYTQSSLCLQSLKGRDRALGLRLDDVCSSSNVFMFLANMERTTSAEEDIGYEDEDFDDSTRLTNVITPLGLCVAGSIDVELSEILQEDPFDRDADSEDEGEFTGNESMPGVLRYHDSVIILVPREKLLRFFDDSVGTNSNSTMNLIDFVCRDAQANPNNRDSRDTAFRIMNEALPKPSSAAFSYYSNFSDGKVQAAIAKWSLDLQNAHLFQAVVGSVISGAYEGTVIGGIFDILARFVNENVSEEHPDWDKWLGILPGKTKFLVVLQGYFTRFELSLSSKHQESFKAWATMKYDERLATQNTFEHEDCPVILQMLESRNLEWAKHSLLPLVSSRATRDFIIKFLDILYSKRGEKHFEKFPCDAFRYLLENNPSILALRAEDLDQERKGRFGICPTPYATDFVELINWSLDLELKAEVTPIIEMVSQDVSSKLDIRLHCGDTLEFMLSFKNAMEKHDECVPVSVVRGLFESLLERIVGTVIRGQPQKPQNWARQPKGCGCPDCVQLHRFLISPNESIGRFKMAERRRKHLTCQLSSTYYRMEIEKHASPHTLIVKKTEGEYADQFREWKLERSRLKNGLNSLQGEYMEALLGGRYQDLILLEQVEESHISGSLPKTANPGRQTLSTKTPQRLNKRDVPPVAGVKRKAKPIVIDLGSDSG